MLPMGIACRCRPSTRYHRSGLPQRHLARFVVEVIDGLDVTAMGKSYRGSGSASYHPAPLLGLLIYGYATGVFSSRGLERGAIQRDRAQPEYAHFGSA
jgi:transposase